MKPLTQQEKNTLETILVIEKDPTVLGTVREILETAGFCVLAANSSAQAIQIERSTKGTIHLLLSEVMMPDMSGPDLAKVLKKDRPEMCVMLMSCYPDGDVVLLNHGWRFIEKPLLPAKLVEKVNDILHSSEPSQGDDRFDTRVEPEVAAESGA